jgi:hypothetical protein
MTQPVLAETIQFKPKMDTDEHGFSMGKCFWRKPSWNPLFDFQKIGPEKSFFIRVHPCPSVVNFLLTA